MTKNPMGLVKKETKPTQLIRYEAARSALEKARTYDEVKEIRNEAIALEAYARQAKDTELIQAAVEIKERAARRADEMLTAAREVGEVVSHGGGTGQGNRGVTLRDLGISKMQASRWGKLGDMSETEFEEHISAKKEAVRCFLDPPISTAAQSILLSSEDAEWYSPAEPIEAARDLMGAIDLDPASSEKANTVVKAKRIFTIADDGLEKSWAARAVWLNPPYGSNAAKFVAKLLSEYQRGNVQEAVLLLSNHATETESFQPLYDYLLCFTKGRLAFWNAKRPDATSATFGSVFIYLGEKPAKFVEIFSQFGTVVAKVAPDKRELEA